MKNKIIKRTSFELGMTVYFNQWNEDPEKSQQVLVGEIIKITEKFCTIDVNGKNMRKAKKNVYFSEDELKLKILRDANDTLLQKFGFGVLKLVDFYDTMSEKYPEKFV